MGLGALGTPMDLYFMGSGGWWDPHGAALYGVGGSWGQGLPWRPTLRGWMAHKTLLQGWGAVEIPMGSHAMGLVAVGSLYGVKMLCSHSLWGQDAVGSLPMGSEDCRFTLQCQDAVGSFSLGREGCGVTLWDQGAVGLCFGVTWLRRASRSISRLCTERRSSSNRLRAVSTSFVLCVTSSVVSVIWGGVGRRVGGTNKSREVSKMEPVRRIPSVG